MRLLSRIYADGPTPSKVFVLQNAQDECLLIVDSGG